MTSGKNIKTIHNQLEQNQTYDDFDSQTAKISDVSTGGFNKYEYLTENYFLSEKGLLEKAVTIKRFAYSPLGSGLKTETGTGKDQYKYLKDQINIINNNMQDNTKVKDDVKTNGEIIVNVDHKYICDIVIVI